MDTFSQAFGELEEQAKGLLRAFVEWHLKESPITLERWKREFADLPPEGTYFDGFNAGVEHTKFALDCWLDEL